MEKRLYQIVLWGSEDSRECRMMLTDEEADILCRLEDELHPLKGYVPHIYVVDVEKSQEEARKYEARIAAERKQKIDHALGLDQPFKTAMAAAFEKATKKGEKSSLFFYLFSMYLLKFTVKSRILGIYY